MAAVMIGVDPHKGSHTAVVIGAAEELPGQVRVRACVTQARQLLAWAAPWPQRTWAVEGAGGLGYLLAQQLAAAGEQVLDVPPRLGARVRLPGSGRTDKNDPNDARSVGIAALRSGTCLPVRAEDHAAVLKVWAKRHRDLSRSRNQVVCRLHAVLCQLIPGGVSKQITAAHPAAPRPRKLADPGGTGARRLRIRPPDPGASCPRPSLRAGGRPRPAVSRLRGRRGSGENGPPKAAARSGDAQAPLNRRNGPVPCAAPQKQQRPARHLSSSSS